MPPSSCAERQHQQVGNCTLGWWRTAWSLSRSKPDTDEAHIMPLTSAQVLRNKHWNVEPRHPTSISLLQGYTLMESPRPSLLLGLTLGQLPSLSSTDGRWGKGNHVRGLRFRRASMCERAWNAGAIKIKLTCYALIITPLTSKQRLFVFERQNHVCFQDLSVLLRYEFTPTPLFIDESSLAVTWRQTCTDLPIKILVH